MNYVVALMILFSFGSVVCSGLLFYILRGTTRARRLVITLKQNEGAFVGLRTEKHWNRWVFENVSLVPTNPGARVDQAAPGRLHVPTRNILYFQEIANVAE